MPTTKSRQQKNPAHQKYEQATKLLYRGDYKKAQSGFESILKKYPDEKHLIARIELFLRLCKANNARPIAAPKGLVELYDAGVYKHNRGDYEKAIDSFSQALPKAGKQPNPSEEPNLGAVHAAMAASYARMGSIENALQNLKKAIEADEVNRFHAQHDPDFDSLDSHEDFQELVTPGKTPH